MGDMSRASLVSDLKASLHDVASKFDASQDADFIRLLDHAALDMGRVRERRVRATITLAASTTLYDAPADIVRVTRTDWGRSENRARYYWDSNYMPNLPELSVLVNVDNTRSLELSREVSAAEIADIGAQCVYYYLAAHGIDDLAANTTVQPEDRGLLLLRAQAEAMSELAFKHVGKPVQLRDGLSNTPRNGTPAALATAMIESWWKQGRGIR